MLPACARWRSPCGPRPECSSPSPETATSSSPARRRRRASGRTSPADPSRRSRGLLVLEALRVPDAAAVRDLSSSLPPSRYNGFHLVFADGREAGVAICDGERLEVRPLAPGEAHLVTERSYGAGEGVREAEVLREVAPPLLNPAVTAAMLRP